MVSKKIAKSHFNEKSKKSIQRGLMGPSVLVKAIVKPYLKENYNSFFLAS